MNQTYRELKQQYTALQQTEAYLNQQADTLRAAFQTFQPASLVFIGCGSGFCLCQSASLTAALSLPIPAYAIPAGDLMLRPDYYAPMLKNSLMIAPTRSGNTSEVILAIAAARSVAQVHVLAISCVEHAAINQVADLTLTLPWAFDQSVCQTRSVTNLYTASLIVTKILAGDRRLDRQIRAVIEQGPAYMEKYEKQLTELGGLDFSTVYILADGEMAGLASEGVMAFCEIAQVIGHHYHVLDVRHGPMVLVNSKTLVLAALSDDMPAQQIKVIEELVARGATVVTHQARAGQPIPGVALAIESGLDLDNAVQGIPFIYLAQIMAVAKAESLGINPDNPDGIVAWVKL